MAERVYNVLFLCTGNTARSVLAEGILRKERAGRFNAYSAGSQPKGVLNPFALKVLESYSYPATGYRSKSWEGFAGPDALQMDFIFTVCDSATGEACPVWLGTPRPRIGALRTRPRSRAPTLRRSGPSFKCSKTCATGPVRSKGALCPNT